MATLNVQPKNKSLWWLWLIIIVAGIAIIYFSIHKDDHKTSDKIIRDSTKTITDTSSVTTDTTTTTP